MSRLKWVDRIFFPPPTKMHIFDCHYTSPAYFLYLRMKQITSDNFIHFALSMPNYQFLFYFVNKITAIVVIEMKM